MENPVANSTEINSNSIELWYNSIELWYNSVGQIENRVEVILKFRGDKFFTN